MEQGRKNVLIVGVDQERFAAIAPMLQRKQFDVDRFPGAMGALELVSVVPFRALILSCPMRGAGIDAFLAMVRKPGSASREAVIALIAETAHLDEARVYLNRGVGMVVSLDDPAEEVDRRLCQLLGIKSRRAFRVMVTLNVTLEDSRREKFVAQTKDISASGMFVTARREYPVGSRAFFEMALPNESKPFAGEAEVVRVVKSGAGRIEGMGVRFVSFIRNTEERLQECLAQLEG